MYYIITDDESILDFAKKKGARILDTDEPVIIKTNEPKSKKVENFFKCFKHVNKKTLGYKCVKYALENNLECTGTAKRMVIPLLANKFNTEQKHIKQAITCFLNNCKYYIVSKDFRIFYSKYNTSCRNQTIEERNLAFIKICQLYLENCM